LKNTGKKMKRRKKRKGQVRGKMGRKEKGMKMMMMMMMMMKGGGLSLSRMTIQALIVSHAKTKKRI
jgi:hypothetical protein